MFSAYYLMLRYAIDVELLKVLINKNCFRLHEFEMNANMQPMEANAKLRNTLHFS